MPQQITADEALKKLLEGNKRYVSNTQLKREYTATREKLRNGQLPFATIISCSDSRVTPEYIFDCDIGDIFCVRIPGNIMTKEVISTVEFAISNFKTPLTIVMGHSNCAAIRASINNVPYQYLKPLLNPITKVVGNEFPEEEEETNSTVKLHAIKIAESIRENSQIVIEQNHTIIAGYYHTGGGNFEILSNEQVFNI